VISHQFAITVNTKSEGSSPKARWVTYANAYSDPPDCFVTFAIRTAKWGLFLSTNCESNILVFSLRVEDIKQYGRTV